MPLQTMHRPKTLDEIVGNETAIKSLASVLSREVDIPHSFLFTGLPGGGKTTLARIIKEYLDISDMDFYEYNAANTRGIDTIRQIDSNCRLSPMGGSKKLYLLDEVHAQTGYALQAILKLLEEPPNHVYFALCTSEPEKIKSTLLKAIRRRCHECEVKPLIRSQIVKLLKDTCKKEEIDYPISILRKIAKSCWGSAGQALSILDSVIDIEDESIAEEAIEDLVVSESSIAEICKLLTDNKLSAINKWHNVKKLLKTLNGEPESIRYAMLGYLNQIMLSKEGLPVKLAGILSCFTDSFMYIGKTGVTLACFFACMESESESDIPF